MRNYTSTLAEAPDGRLADPMSALGQKQTFAMHTVMSALPPIADMCGAQVMSAKCQ